MKRWVKQVSIAIDQTLNALFCGWADETLSSRCWRNRNRPGWKQARHIVDVVAKLLGDANHCESSYRSERLRLQSPPELRQDGIAEK